MSFLNKGRKKGDVGSCRTSSSPSYSCFVRRWLKNPQPFLRRRLPADDLRPSVVDHVIHTDSISMNQTNVYRSVERDRSGSSGTVKMLPRSNSVLQDKLDRDAVDVGSTTALNSGHHTKKITRSNLVDQLREYQVRSKHNWASVSFFSSTSNLSSSRVDVVVFVLWELVILAFFVFSAVSLYFRHLRLGFVLATITLLLLLSMKVTKRIKLAQKKKRRMLLPLSM